MLKIRRYRKDDLVVVAKIVFGDRTISGLSGMDN